MQIEVSYKCSDGSYHPTQREAWHHEVAIAMCKEINFESGKPIVQILEENMDIIESAIMLMRDN